MAKPQVTKMPHAVTLTAEISQVVPVNLLRIKILDTIGDKLAARYNGEVAGSFAGDKIEVYLFFKTKESADKAVKIGVPALLEQYKEHIRSISVKIKKA